MPRRPKRAVPVVIVHGWQGSGPDHWQSWLAAQLRESGREVRYPQLPDDGTPHLDHWLHVLRATLMGLPDGGFDVLAHSLGAVLWLHHVAMPNDTPRPARVALIAPPAPGTAIPELGEFFPPPLGVDVVRHAAEGTVLVGGDDDPYTPEGLGAAYGLPLKIATTIVPGGGHLNDSAGYGPWPAVLDWCNRDNLAFY
jgi:predicted alpha/beta hydrolase family esterase